MPDAETQFREALYRSAIEAAYFLKRLCEGTEEVTPDTSRTGLRLGAASELIASVLRVMVPETDPFAPNDLELVEILAE